MHENDPRRGAPGVLCSDQILSHKPPLHGHIQCRRDGQGHQGAGQHIAAVVDQGINLRAVKHAEAGDLRGHIDAVDGDAAEVVDQEPSRTAQDRARKNAPAPAPEEARQAQWREGQQIIQNHALPAPGVGPVENELQTAENEPRQDSPAHAPADRVHEDREHGRRDGAALGELVELQKAQYLGRRHQHGSLGQRPDAQMPFVSHDVLLHKKIAALPIPSWVQCDNGLCKSASFPTTA